MSEPGHGHSVAAWTGVGILLVASTLLSVGVYFGLHWAIWIGAALVLVGIGAWYGLALAGYGEKAHGARGDTARGTADDPTPGVARDTTRGRARDEAH